jgi:hypothetical protein
MILIFKSDANSCIIIHPSLYVTSSNANKWILNTYGICLVLLDNQTKCTETLSPFHVIIS